MLGLHFPPWGTAMTHFNYIEEAHSTCSDQYHGHAVAFHKFTQAAEAFVRAAEDLDVIKKALFYGAEAGFSKARLTDISLNLAPQWIADNPEFEGHAADVLHGIIGKATEAGELMELLLKTISDGQPFDSTNCIEEVGDGQWYDAIILRALGSNFDEVQRKNIAKLRDRYPNKFTEYDAKNRNLEKERETLEKPLDEE